MQTRSLFVRPACTYSTLTPYALHSTPYTLHQITNALATNVSAAKHFFFFCLFFCGFEKKHYLCTEICLFAFARVRGMFKVMMTY